MIPQSEADQLAALLGRHKPVLRYDSQGSFYADSARTMPERSGGRSDANRLVRANDDVIATAGGGGSPVPLTLEFLAARRYGDGNNVQKGDHLDAVGRDYVLQARELHAIPEYANRIFGHVAIDEENDEHCWLQYWFFYYYNDKAFLGVGLHEGDWEMVQIRLDRERSPAAMTFAQHAHGERCSWRQMEKRAGERPVVYVARGSQASYPRPGRHRAPIVPDTADGRGSEVSPTLELLDGPDTRWVGWPGRWGSSVARSIIESNSPFGPKQHSQWTRPAEFHADAVDKLELQGMVQGQPELLVAPAPRLRAERVGDRAVVHFAFPRPRRGESHATQIVVSVDSSEDDLPPATYSFPASAAQGEIEHPLPLEDRRYVVRASGFTREAVASETVEVPLGRVSTRRRR